MTVSTTQTKVEYIGNNLARVWALPYPVLSPAHIMLIETDMATGQEVPIASGYEVKGFRNS